MNELIRSLSEVFRPDEHDELMRSHHEALGCSELEARLGVGVVYFQYINRRHKSWYAEVTERGASYRVEDAEAFACEYAGWLRAANFFLALADQFEERGYTVDNAAKVREFAEQISCVNLNMRESLEAIGRLERGEGIGLDEFFDAQRRKRNQSPRP